MGVVFKICAACNETFPDCGPYFSCGCGERFCSPECGGGRQYLPLDKEQLEISPDPASWDDNTSCIFCRFEQAHTRDILAFLLNHVGMTYDKVFGMW